MSQLRSVGQALVYDMCPCENGRRDTVIHMNPGGRPHKHEHRALGDATTDETLTTLLVVVRKA